MPRKANMTLDEMVDYLLKDLSKSVVNDVKPCLQLGSEVGGFFAAPRLVLSYVDYFGALYHGYQGRVSSGRRIFADSSYAKRFLRDVFGLIDKNYAAYGDLLWEIYRNGTVHLYEPLMLENGGKTMRWQIIKTPSPDRTVSLPIGHDRAFLALTHLVPMQVESTVWIQPISTGCLYNDLLQVIEKYSELLRNDTVLQLRFRSVMDQLVIPVHTSLTWT